MKENLLRWFKMESEEWTQEELQQLVNLTTNKIIAIAKARDKQNQKR